MRRRASGPLSRHRGVQMASGKERCYLMQQLRHFEQNVAQTGVEPRLL
jgi:hypothetical protein